MTRPQDDNTPPAAPHASGTDTDPHRDGGSEARADLLRRLLDTLGWESGTEEQALEALADAVRVARGGRMGKDVHLQRNEARAECERLRRELSAAREAVGEGWFAGGATLAEAIRRKVSALETHLRGLTRARELMSRKKVSERILLLTEDRDVVAYMTPGCGDLTLADYFGNDAPGRFAVVRLENEGPEGGAR